MKVVPPDVSFSGQNAPLSISAGLCARPRWGSLQRSPEHLSVFKGTYC